MPDVEEQVVSVNVGSCRQIIWNSRPLTIGIFKEPIAGRVRLGRLGFDGDKQADLTVHGGPEKAVYAYPSEHYDYWGRELGPPPLPWGMFGENLTTQGLREDEVRLGDEFRVGSATLAVTRPRFPCYKLGIKFGTMNMVKRFQASGRSGFYLSVLEEGEIVAGDKIQLIYRDSSSPTISEVFTSNPTEG